MSAVSSKLRRWAANDGTAGYTYWCQGCEMLHGADGRRWRLTMAVIGWMWAGLAIGGMLLLATLLLCVLWPVMLTVEWAKAR